MKANPIKQFENLLALARLGREVAQSKGWAWCERHDSIEPASQCEAEGCIDAPDCPVPPALAALEGEDDE